MRPCRSAVVAALHHHAHESGRAATGRRSQTETYGREVSQRLGRAAGQGKIHGRRSTPGRGERRRSATAPHFSVCRCFVSSFPLMGECPSPPYALVPPPLFLISRVCVPAADALGVFHPAAPETEHDTRTRSKSREAPTTWAASITLRTLVRHCHRLKCSPSSFADCERAD